MKNYIFLLCLGLGFIQTMQIESSTTINILPNQTLTQLWISPVFQSEFYADLPIHTTFPKDWTAIQKALANGPVKITVEVQQDKANHYQVLFTAYDTNKLVATHTFKKIKSKNTIIPTSAPYIYSNVSFQTTGMNNLAMQNPLRNTAFTIYLQPMTLKATQACISECITSCQQATPDRIL